MILCSLRTPEVTKLEQTDKLRFEAIDLCKEVLSDEKNGWLCEWLNNYTNCNWMTREMLVFTISYAPTTSGCKIGIRIDGKIGSGLYRQVKRGAYRDIAIEHESYLKRFAEAFTEDLRQVIITGDPTYRSKKP